MKKIVIYDLDGTLAPSKSPVDGEMSELLMRLLAVAKVAVISGGAWSQFEHQLLANLPTHALLANLFILPTCGTQYYRHDAGWKKVYSEDFTPAESETIKAALKQAVAECGVAPERLWGEQIEDRGSQITFSALGQQAPLGAKSAWDPDFAKRKRMKAVLDPLLPKFSVRLGGTTSIDVTQPGIDKAYGIRKLRDLLSISIEEMLFMGDAIFPGGNDYPAVEAGVDSIRVRDPEETKRVTEGVVACLKGASH